MKIRIFQSFHYSGNFAPLRGKISNQLEKEHYGEKHGQIARSCLLIGIELREHEHYEEALKYLFEALAIDIECFGEEHPRVAKIYQALGNTYNNNEEYKQAMKYFNNAKEINPPQVANSIYGIMDLNRKTIKKPGILHIDL